LLFKYLTKPLLPASPSIHPPFSSLFSLLLSSLFSLLLSSLFSCGRGDEPRRDQNRSDQDHRAKAGAINIPQPRFILIQSTIIRSYLMARALSTSPLFKTLLFPAPGRAFIAAAQAVRPATKPDDKAPLAQLFAAKRVAAAHPDPWVPDPVTGYYRPASASAKAPVELDAAELRAMLLTPKAN
jgi:Late embryogenesis abundant protein